MVLEKLVKKYSQAALLIIPILILSICLTGCGSKKKETQPAFLKSKDRKRQETMTDKTLSAGNYTVGYDLPEGIYTLKKNENSGDITIVRKHCPAENFHIDDTHHYSRTFETGDIIVVHGNANIKALSSNSSTTAVKPRPNLPSYESNQDTRDSTSINGECVVGQKSEEYEDTPEPGWYIVKIENDTMVHVKVEGKLGEDIDEDLSFNGTKGPSLYRNVYLRNGQKISVTNIDGNPENDSDAYAEFIPLEASENETAEDSYGITTEKDEQENNDVSF